MSHQNPEHALAPVLDRALDALLEKLERAQRAKLVSREKTTALGKEKTTATEARDCTKAAAGQRRRGEKPQTATPAQAVPLIDERQLDLWEFAASRATASTPAPARVNAPRRAEKSPKSPSRHIPRPLRRATFERAGGVHAGTEGERITDSEGCSFISEDGHRCGSRHFLEIDHRTPWSLDPRHEARNLRVLCRAHNQLVARELIGPREGTAGRRG